MPPPRQLQVAARRQSIFSTITEGSLLGFRVHLAAHSSPTPRSFWQVALILLCLNFPRYKRGYCGICLPGTIRNCWLAAESFQAHRLKSRAVLTLIILRKPATLQDGFIPALDPKGDCSCGLSCVYGWKLGSDEGTGKGQVNPGRSMFWVCNICAHPDLLLEGQWLESTDPEAPPC